MGAAVQGNVATGRRLDFTATGASVALVSRFEGLTRTLDAPLLAGRAFASLMPDPSPVSFDPLG